MRAEVFCYLMVKGFGKNVIIFGTDLSLSAYLPMLMIEKQS